MSSCLGGKKSSTTLRVTLASSLPLRRSAVALLGEPLRWAAMPTAKARGVKPQDRTADAPTSLPLR
ncbi:hypothetical protein I8748_01850 [Nostoc sp. CENA67]|uniref:Uncharacterized protein n=1 Tax=Amazonocrinis nigriterrae CENA67 TaxID=2794033 RepID=A0A8J7L6C0_9NOST|nr:hypothetical protein [Amazonocrinis nigriterrae]MBH8560935.1 hypothetical protein [Amazonocrinis nigriterrae CENA67]